MVDQVQKKQARDLSPDFPRVRVRDLSLVFLYLIYVELSPYRPESFDGIIKNKLPGKRFFFDPSEVPLCRTYARALYPGASQYIAN